ncbi:hypothetical protein L0F63_001477, partial [Massospora cicadina]
MKKHSAATATLGRKKAKVYVNKAPIIKALLAPNSWDLETLPSIVLPELNEANATEANVNAIFSLPSSSKVKLAKYIPKGILDTFETARESGLLFRRVTLDFINYTNARSNRPAAPLIIDGARGSGKSVLLLQIVAQMLLRDWLV